MQLLPFLEIREGQIISFSRNRAWERILLSKPMTHPEITPVGRNISMKRLQLILSTYGVNEGSTAIPNVKKDNGYMLSACIDKGGLL